MFMKEKNKFIKIIINVLPSGSSGSEVTKNIMHNSAEHEFFPAHKHKMLTIETFTSRKNSIIGLAGHEKAKFLEFFTLMSISNFMLK